MPGGHDHAQGLTATGRHSGRLTAVMAISDGIAAAEIIGALISGSLVLLADAAHMAADAAGVGLSLLAALLATRPATDRRTFGYARAEILAATVNALLLLGLAAFIVVEAVQRLAAPPPVGSGADDRFRRGGAGRERRVAAPAAARAGAEPERARGVPGSRLGHPSAPWPSSSAGS